MLIRVPVCTTGALSKDEHGESDSLARRNAETSEHNSLPCVSPLAKNPSR